MLCACVWLRKLDMCLSVIVTKLRVMCACLWLWQAENCMCAYMLGIITAASKPSYCLVLSRVRETCYHYEAWYAVVCSRVI